MFTDIVNKKISSVLNAFETGSKDGDYSNVSIYPDGVNNSLQVTFGKMQTTENGNLKTLLKMYVAAKGEYADYFIPKIPLIGKISLVKDETFIATLKLSGKEQIMRDTQDLFFEQIYGEKARAFYYENKFSLPLSYLVIFDSIIHSGKIRDDIRDMFSEVPPSMGGDEKAWILAYVKARRKWWKAHANNPYKGVEGKGTYRADCFLDAIKKSNWDLSKTINANGVSV